MEKFNRKQIFSLNNILSKPISAQFIKFCIVGSSGILVDLGVLWFLVEYVHLWYIYGSCKSLLFKQVFFEYIKYWSVSLVSIFIQLGMLFTLVEFAHIWYILAALIGIGCGFLINFVGNKFWTFGFKGFISGKY